MMQILRNMARRRVRTGLTVLGIAIGTFALTVIGSKVATSLNLGVGSTLTWRKNDYTVVGIMSETNTFPDNFAVMPLDVVRRDLKFPATAVGSLSVVPEPGVDPEVVTGRIND